MRNDFPRFSRACRAHYGATWTLRLPGGPPAVVTMDREAIRELLTGNPLERRNAQDLLKPVLGSHSLFVLEPAEHLARRRIESSAFRGDRLKAHAEIVRRVVEREVHSWRDCSVIGVQSRARVLMSSLMIETVIGAHDPAQMTRLAAAFDLLLQPTNDLALAIPPLMKRSRLNPFSRSFWAHRDCLEALLRAEIVRARTDACLESRQDVLALLVTARDEQGHGLSDDVLVDELITLVGAGHDTMASAIAWGADLLAHNPRVVRRLRASMEEGDHGYLRGTAKEVLRARTVVPFSVSRRTVAPFAIGGGVIGRGVRVYVDADGLHRDPDLHPDAHSFRPERFLGGQADAYSYLPFGGGAHRCLGATLATLSLEIALATMVRHCSFEPCGPPARPVRRLFLTPDNGVRVRVTTRATTGPPVV